MFLHVRLVLSFLLAVSLALLPAPLRLHAAADSGILYVKADEGTSGDCSTWQKACALQTALGQASSGDEIWVAVGIHLPDVGAGQTDDDLNSTFRLKDGVALYGGFSGAEAVRTERSWQSNATVLSGDIEGNDMVDATGVVTNPWTIEGTNALSVLVANGVSRSAVLDGFTVTAAGAWGGVSCDDSSPTMSNVRFVGNRVGVSNENNSRPALLNVVFRNNGTFGRGGMFNTNSDPLLLNVTFEHNHNLQGSGGGMDNWNSSPTLVNVVFSGNSAWTGGGMSNHESDPLLINVTFSGNYGYRSGGAMDNYLSNPTIHNSILWGNASEDWTGTAPDSIHNEESNPVVANSVVQGSGGSGSGWDTTLGTDGGHNFDYDPRFIRNPDLGHEIYNRWNRDLGDLRLQVDSPAIDVGNAAFLPADHLDMDLDGDKSEPCPFDLDNRRRIAYDSVDAGAYEFPLKTVFLPTILR